MAEAKPIRIAHVLFHFGIGGLENGLVNLINGLPEQDYQHHIVCLTDFDEWYVSRLRSSNFELHSLHKQQGQDPAIWLRMWRVLRKTRPHVLHTRNFVALEMQCLGALAGVRGRVHGEHGWDVHDLDGAVRKYRIARRVISPFVDRFVALSRQLEDYLVDAVGVAPDKVSQIYNGVDCGRFLPNPREHAESPVIGTVGRMKAVKNQTLLCRAFIQLVKRRPDFAHTRLRLVGSGPLLSDCRALVAAAGLTGRVDFIGDSDTVAEEMNAMDIFVLPSLAEGISNTILEAMASGLPVIAASVGGNPELVLDGRTGTLVESDDESGLAAALECYLDNPGLRLTHGREGRNRAEQQFSLDGMVASYDALYRSLASTRMLTHLGVRPG